MVFLLKTHTKTSACTCLGFLVLVASRSFRGIQDVKQDRVLSAGGTSRAMIMRSSCSVFYTGVFSQWFHSSGMTMALRVGRPTQGMIRKFSQHMVHFSGP